jgi:nitroreductase
VLAASAHNTQPWLFAVTPARIDLFAVPSRNIGTVDPLRREMQISLGCALENLVLAGPPHGLAPTVPLLPDPADQAHVARVDLAPAPATTTALFRAIPHRHTNRAAYDTSRPLPAGTLSALTGLVGNPGGQVVWLTGAAAKHAFGNLTVAAT